MFLFFFYKQVNSTIGGSSLLSADICNDDTECLIQSENRLVTTIPMHEESIAKVLGQFFNFLLAQHYTNILANFQVYDKTELICYELHT